MNEDKINVKCIFTLVIYVILVLINNYAKKKNNCANSFTDLEHRIEFLDK